MTTLYTYYHSVATSALYSKKRRRAFTIDDKKRVRTCYAQCIGKGQTPSQSDIVQHDKNALNLDIDQTLFSKWLNEKNTKFDNTPLSSKTQLSYRTRKRPLDVLEKALSLSGFAGMKMISISRGPYCNTRPRYSSICGLSIRIWRSPALVEVGVRSFKRSTALRSA